MQDTVDSLWLNIFNFNIYFGFPKSATEEFASFCEVESSSCTSITYLHMVHRCRSRIAMMQLFFVTNVHNVNKFYCPRTVYDTVSPAQIGNVCLHLFLCRWYFQTGIRQFWVGLQNMKDDVLECMKLRWIPIQHVRWEPHQFDSDSTSGSSDQLRLPFVYFVPKKYKEHRMRHSLRSWSRQVRTWTVEALTGTLSASARSPVHTKNWEFEKQMMPTYAGYHYKMNVRANTYSISSNKITSWYNGKKHA